MSGREDTFVYILGTSLPNGKMGPSKVGITKNPRKRLSSLQTACPYKIDGFYSLKIGDPQCARFIERDLLDRMAENSIHGEWIDLSFFEVAGIAVDYIMAGFLDCWSERTPAHIFDYIGLNHLQSELLKRVAA